VAEDGARVIAACDSKCGIYAENGLDIQAVAETQRDDRHLALGSKE
jgi:glutamate dehydrogenase/leucine dehydrogenase